MGTRFDSLKTIKGIKDVPRGGRRDGAGRKPGAVTLRTRAAADRDVAAGGTEPLDLVLERMRFHAARGEEHAAKGEDDAAQKEYDRAIPLAVFALPYRHPRLSNVTLDGEVSVSAGVTPADAEAGRRRVEEHRRLRLSHRPDAPASEGAADGRAAAG